MSLDINKVVIKTSITSCFGNSFSDVEGATQFLEELANEAEEISLAPGDYIFREKDKSDWYCQVNE